MIKERFKAIIYLFFNLINPLFRLFFGLPRVSVLMYHSIRDIPVLFTVFLKDFSRQLEYLKKHNFNVISLADFLILLKSNQNLPDKTVALTFDDGFRDNFENAWPQLKKYNFPAAIFVATDFIGKEMNNSQNRPLEILTETQIKEMADSGLIEFGSHTHTHPRLDQISDKEFEEEIVRSKVIIEKITGKVCRFFAYPKGYFKPSFEQILKNNGYEAAFGVGEGLTAKGDNLFALKRNFIYSSGGFAQFKGKLNYSVLIYNLFKKVLKK